MILMDYHLVFIVLSFLLIILTAHFLFFETTKESIIAAMIMSGLNFGLCTINYLGFMGIGLLSIDITTGDPTITTSAEMFPVFAFFFMLHYINIAFLFWCWYKFTRTVWEIKT